MEEKIRDYLNRFDFDIRQIRDARFMDQKITPDVLCIIADCVINFTNKNHNLEFTTKEIWESSYANQNVKDIFNKPGVLTAAAKHEYDKFFAQPLKMLAYAKILKCEKRDRKNYFVVKKREILNFISIKERNALKFLNIYLEKVLMDSDLWELFDNFFTNNSKEKFNHLKDTYEKFIINNTAINGKTEVRRIFTKVINPLAHVRNSHGTKKGFYSPDIIGYDDLMYNRRNWRDVRKLRGETRQEYEARAKREVERSREALVNLMKEKVKRYHYPSSEVKDQYSSGIATQVHHIFPRYDFPQLEATLENLILLTGTQHSAYAHPENHTRKIDLNYQSLCLLSKSKSVQDSVSISDNFYSKDDFVFVLNEGINPTNNFNKNGSFNEIRRKISEEYTKHNN